MAKRMDKTNSISTWVQGRFIDGEAYDHMPADWKERRKNEECHLVRNGHGGSAICWCNDPEDAKWIAERLNLAAKLEVTGVVKDESKVARVGV